MDLRQLATFLSVADAGSFTVAADRLHIAQSAVSVTIRSLEEELTTPLFIRSARGSSLTTAGQALLPQARATLAAVDAARLAVNATRLGLTGSVEVGVVPSQPTGAFSMPSVLTAFYRSHPNVDVRVRHRRTVPAIIAGLHDRSLDVAFLTIGATEAGDQQLTVRTVADDVLCVAVPPTSPLAQREAVSLGQIADAPFVDFLEGYGSRATTDALFARAGAPRSTPFEVTDVAEAVQYVKDGLAIAVLPASLISDASELPTLDLLGPTPRFEISVAMRHRTPLSSAARALVATAVSTNPRVPSDPSDVAR